MTSNHNDHTTKMLGDRTLPANKIIFGLAMGSALTLVGLKPVFDAYYDHMIRAEETNAVVRAEAGYSQLNALRERENQKLAHIEQATAGVARALTAPEARPIAIMPTAAGSTNDALIGWTKLPKHQVSSTRGQSRFVAPPPPVEVLPVDPAAVPGEAAPALAPDQHGPPNADSHNQQNMGAQ